MRSDDVCVIGAGPYGLTAAVYSRDPERAERVLRALPTGSSYWNCSDRVSPRRDWYIWSKERPEDWDEGMVFPGVQDRTWTYDRKAREYYFHRFFEFQPDLNTGHPGVRREIDRIELPGQTLVSDGRTLWSYSPDDNQVVVQDYTEEDLGFFQDVWFHDLASGTSSSELSGAFADDRIAENFLSASPDGRWVLDFAFRLEEWEGDVALGALPLSISATTGSSGRTRTSIHTATMASIALAPANAAAWTCTASPRP